MSEELCHSYFALSQIFFLGREWSHPCVARQQASPLLLVNRVLKNSFQLSLGGGELSFGVRNSRVSRPLYHVNP